MYSTHWDCKSNTGMIMSLGKGAVMSFSKKQKLNTRSSTEAELVGIDDTIPSIMWCLYFIQAQGYDATNDILYKDKNSTILLATNGQMLSLHCTKQINAQYFLVKDKQDGSKIEIQYEPTDCMWSDVLTKPKQG